MKIVYSNLFKLNSYRHNLNIALLRARENFQKDQQSTTISNIIYPIDSFLSQYSIHKFKNTSDQEIGGNSLSRISFHDDHLLMEGRLSEDEENVLESTPYVGFYHQLGCAINTKRFNGLQMQMKSDGSIYKVVLIVKSQYELSHQIYGYVVDKSYQWQEIMLPFENFQINKTSKDESGNMRMGNMAQDLKIQSIGIIRESKYKEEFSFGLRNIKLIYDNNIPNLVKGYQSPYFLYSMGGSKYTSGKDSQIVDINRVKVRSGNFVNNFY